MKKLIQKNPRYREEISKEISNIFDRYKIPKEDRFGDESFWINVEDISKKNKVDGKILRQLGDEWEESDLNPFPIVETLLNMFTQINKDCKESGESVVPFSDTEYYSTQISNMYEEQGITDEEAENLAKQLSQLSERVIMKVEKISKK